MRAHEPTNTPQYYLITDRDRYTKVHTKEYEIQQTVTSGQNSFVYLLLIMCVKMYKKFFKNKVVHKVMGIAIICLGAVSVYEYAVFSGMLRAQMGKIPGQEFSDVDTKEFLINQRILKHNITVQKYFEKRKDWVTSKLGSVMFKNTPPPSPRNRTFDVLIWKYWSWLKNRHVESFNHDRGGILDDCSVHNCIFSSEDEMLQSADAVVIHIQHGEVPSVSNRDPNQRWVFLSDESPKNSFTMAKRIPNLLNWIQVFNWSMTYRSDADVPVPYGRTLPLVTPLMPDVMSDTIAKYVPYWENKQREVLVTVLMSNCDVSERMNYLSELRKHVDVTMYGKCSGDENKNRCPGHFKEDCTVTTEYFFYLVLENSKCRQYLTEKSFHNAYSKGAIPIIMGPPLSDCEKLLPPNSFLHVDNYDSAEELAKDIKRISKNDESLLAYHQWRNNFEVVNEHGYFGSKSFHFCRICEALNYNDETMSTYRLNDLELFLDKKALCKGR